MRSRYFLIKLKIKRVCILYSLLYLSASVISAQTKPLIDTLSASIKTESRFPVYGGNNASALPDEVRGLLSPLGEGDPVRWAQNLPGVATGADGGSSFYVRGGNMGNNSISIDGVPLYGFSHLLGLTTVIPVSVIERAEFKKGGYDGGESNFTASRLNIISKDPIDSLGVCTSLNTFLLSAECEGHVSEKCSFLLSARVSPLSWEYRLIKPVMADALNGFDRFGTKIGDVYGKMIYHLNDKHYVELAGLGSLDEYAFSVKQNIDNELGWHNGMASLRIHSQTAKSVSDVATYVSLFGTRQMQNTVIRDSRNQLSLKSGLQEMSIYANKTRMSNHFILGYGGKVSYFHFDSGQVASISNNNASMLCNLYFQPQYDISDILRLKAVFRMNYYMLRKDIKGRVDPEFSISSRYSVSPVLSFEASFDRLVQYCHSLEGLPVGWSLDMIVPSDTDVRPETVMQSSVNVLFRKGPHHASLGGFYKNMNNLVYYKYAQSLFYGGMTEWKSQIDQGKGKAYGMECLYDLFLNDWSLHLSYTLSKTNRYAFESINGGEPFNARFNRNHILQVRGAWKNLTLSMLLESGHWENGAAQSYPMHILGGIEWRCDYYAGVNDHHMPMIFRIDVGHRWNFDIGNTKHEVNIGVCNLTNHFNPFMLYFDGATESWKELALLPVMPNIGYMVSF